MVSITCKHIVYHERIDIIFELESSSGIRVNLWTLECRMKHFRFKDHFIHSMDGLISWLNQEIQPVPSGNWIMSLIKEDVKTTPSQFQFKDSASLSWKGWQPHYRTVAVDGPLWIGIKAKCINWTRFFSLEGTAMTSYLGIGAMRDFRQNLMDLKDGILKLHYDFSKSIVPVTIKGIIKLAPYHFRVVGDECLESMVSRRIGNYNTKGGWLVSSKAIFKKFEGESDLPEPLDDYLPSELFIGKKEGDVLIIHYSEHVTLQALCQQRDDSSILDQPLFEEVFLSNAKGDFGVLDHNIFDSHETLHPLPKSVQYKYLEEFRQLLLETKQGK